MDYLAGARILHERVTQWTPVVPPQDTPQPREDAPTGSDSAVVGRLREWLGPAAPHRRSA